MPNPMGALAANGAAAVAGMPGCATASPSPASAPADMGVSPAAGCGEDADPVGVPPMPCAACITASLQEGRSVPALTGGAGAMQGLEGFGAAAAAASAAEAVQRLMLAPPSDAGAASLQAVLPGGTL